MSRVLVSTEDPSLAGELVRQARQLGLRLSMATSPTTLDQTRLLTPDLVVLDLNQKIDGRLLLARLKQDPRTTGIRIAVLSARNDENIQRFCREMRVSDFYAKPLIGGYLARLVGAPNSFVAAACAG